MDDLSDEALVTLLAAGQQEALGPLHARYAGLVFNVAARSLDRAAAEEIVQDVLVAVWRKADMYDAQRGPVRPWILRIAHLRVISELRRRGRRPATSVADDKPRLANRTADRTPLPDDLAWREYRRVAIRTAVAALPPPQRQALSLAFFQELTHEQIATFLGVPLGTTKTRIRTGLRRLRSPLMGLLAIVLLLTAGLVTAVVENHRRLDSLHRNEDALQMVTSSDTEVLRLVPTPGTPAAERDTHATYRASPGADVAVVTFSHFAPPPAGQAFQAWANVGGTWYSLGLVEPDDDGHDLVIVDQPRATPEALQVTLEPAGGSARPHGPAVVSWSSP